MKIKLSDVSWKIHLLTRDSFNEKFENGEALTDVEEHKIYFIKDAVYETTVRHEVFHAYFTCALVGSSDLNGDQTEEVAAEVVGKYGEEIIKNSRKIYKWLKNQSLK